MQTRLRLRKHLPSRSHQAPVQSHQAPVQLHQVPVQPNLFALPQPIFDSESADTTEPPPPPPPPPPLPPPPPQIVDIIPHYGPHFASQRVWVNVQNLPRDNCQKYLIGFGEAGTMAASFVTAEGDQVQILECTTPVIPIPYTAFLSLMYDHDPQTPIATGLVHYTFALGY
jgi:hypothetical protein